MDTLSVFTSRLDLKKTQNVQGSVHFAMSSRFLVNHIETIRSVISSNPKPGAWVKKPAV
jgi:hypothetical protein